MYLLFVLIQMLFTTLIIYSVQIQTSTFVCARSNKMLFVNIFVNIIKWLKIFFFFKVLVFILFYLFFFYKHFLFYIHTYYHLYIVRYLSTGSDKIFNSFLFHKYIYNMYNIDTIFNLNIET